MSTFSPTEEQQIALWYYRSAEDLVIEAAAGAGKTSTLELLARYAPNRRGYYLAFNRGIAQEAKERFAGTGVQALTMHSLALRSVPPFFREKLARANKFTNWGTVAKALSIDEDFRFTSETARFTDRIRREQLVRCVRDTAAKFMRSATRELTFEHVQYPRNLVVDEAGMAELGAVILHYAQLLWQDYASPDGRLPLVHDAYLKYWQLSNPVLPADFIMLDESQDADELMTSVLLQQQTQRILVGDRNQAIYSWRTGTVNAMDALPNAHRAQLTQSFRFGPRVAEEAQKWLDLLGADLNITGTESITSTVEQQVHRPDAIICRTNAGAIVDVLGSLRRRTAVGIAGDRKAAELSKLAQAAVDLKKGRRTRHAEFQVFETWDQLVEFAQSEDGGEIESLVNIINRFGGQSVVDAIDSCDMDGADVVVSTAHIAKGLEWGRVSIADDFPSPVLSRERDELPQLRAEEARLAYVTVTRAKRALGVGGLSWVDSYAPGEIELT
ncbi:UvrD-helicase domain-containing protein [Leucobacter sp. HY1910]